jgi:hypothetical protein
MKNTSTTAIILSGRWHAIGRLAWWLLVLLCLALLAYSLITVPPILADIGQRYDGLEAVLAAIPLARRYLLVIAFYSTSIAVFRQRSHELGPLLMACLYAGLGSVPLATGIFNLAAGVMVVPPALDLLAIIVLALGVSFGILSVYVFPDGRFVPYQARWVLIPIAFLAVAYAVGFHTTRNIPLPIFGLVMVTLVLGVYSQVYRYRYHENLTQRQQVKWYVYGVVSFIVAQTIAAIIQRQIGPLGSLPALLGATLAEVLFFLSYLLVLVTNLVAIIRYRLFDINYVINRSIVYAGLTLLLGGLFAAVFFGLQFLLDRLLGGELPVISAGLAGALVILIFQPTRRHVSRLVDRHLYGIALDYAPVDLPRLAAPLSGNNDATGTFGSLRELTLIGRGGMGDVYRAVHITKQVPVAVKLLKEADGVNVEARRRFRREAETIARLQHPNIVTLYEIGEQQDMFYMVMEYVAGQTVSQLLAEQGRLSPSETAVIITDVATALDYAHAQAVVHRDIKPSNIVVRENTGRAVLMDFGIAKIAAETQLTQAGGMIGTLDYIAPEQIQGAPEVDYRADIYSLGVMAYQMLTGELPFQQNNPGALVIAHLMQPPPDPRAKVAAIPAAMARAVMRAMSKKPTERFATAGEMAAHFTPVPLSL